MAQRPLSLILARNLLGSISTPGFLVDAHGVLAFWNEPAGMLIGRRYEETGKLPPDQWGDTIGPFDENGDAIPWDHLPLTHELRRDRPVHSRVLIRDAAGTDHAIEISALPLVTHEGFTGALAVFWPIGESA